MFCIVIRYVGKSIKIEYIFLIIEHYIKMTLPNPINKIIVSYIIEDVYELLSDEKNLEMMQ